MNTNKILLIVAILWALWWFFPKLRSGYAPLTTNLGNLIPDIFSNKTDLNCQPGMLPDGDYYSQENGKGMCSAQNYVHKLGHEYEIVEGIGH